MAEDATREDSTGLVQTAVALNTELDKHERLVRSLEGCELDSQKSIGKAAELAREANDTQARITLLVRDLLDSIHRVRERNMGAVDRANSCIEQLEVRSERLKTLLDKFAELGQEAHSVNASALEMRSKTNGKPGEEHVGRLQELAGRMQQIRDGAKQLSDDSKAAGFADLVKQADALAQQLGSLENKLKLLAEKLR
jgi:methyl-accepting chemotaxis protein